MQGALRTQHPSLAARHRSAKPHPSHLVLQESQLRRKAERWHRGQEEGKQKGLAGSQGLPEGQSLPERQRRVWEAPPAGSKAGAREHHRLPSAGSTTEPRAEAHAPPWAPGAVPREERAVSHTQGKRPRWLLYLVKFSFNQTRLIIDSTRMKLE